MSKHLRFGRLLSLLAILLTVSFASVQGQNTSPDKVLSHLKFTDADNAALYGDVVGTVTEGTRVISVVLPYRYNTGQPDAVASALLKASFKSSEFSNVFKGMGLATDLADLTPVTGWRATHEMGQGLGIVPNAPYILSTKGYTFADGDILTVEAQNHSYVHYTLAITFDAPSTASAIIGTPTAMRTKSWGTTCSPATETAAATVTLTGSTFNVAVPYGTNLAAVPFNFTIPAFAKAFYGAAPGTAILPSPNYGAILASPIALTFTANLTSDLTLTVYPQGYPTTSPSPTVYTIHAVVGLPSLEDHMTAISVNTAPLTIDMNTQTMSATVPYSATSASVTFTVSKYARVWNIDPDLGASEVERCSPLTVPTVDPGPWVVNFWVQAEDPSEVSLYTLTLTRAACVDVNTLDAISATYSKANSCGAAYTGTVTGAIVSASTNTIGFSTPYGVTSVAVSSRTPTSTLAKNNSVGLSKVTGDTIRVTSECGTLRTYTVTVTPATLASDAKQLLTFGFKAASNLGLGFNWNGLNYAGVIDQVNKTVTVTVPFVTDLHQLKAYFTKSDYSCVFIANTDGYVAQTSDVNVNDHSNRLTYVVRAENGTEDRYEVTVLKTPASSVSTLSGFVVSNVYTCPDLGANPYNVNGVIDGTNVTVSVKAGTDVTALAYNFTLGSPLANVAISNGSITHAAFTSAVTGSANFTSPVTITVTAEDLTTTVYTVTVVPRAANSEKVLTSYMFTSLGNTIGNADAVGVIDQATRIVTVHVPYGSDVDHMIATFVLNNNTNNFPGGAVMTHSEDMQAIQTSGATSNDFSEQVAYTIFAEDCSTLEYFVNVIVDANANNDILTMAFSGLENYECETCEPSVPVSRMATVADVVGVGGVVEGTIKFKVPYGTDLTSFVLTTTASAGATMMPASITSYTTSQVIWVTAANGISKKKYTLTIEKEAALTGSQLLTFGFEAENNEEVLSEDRWTAVPVNHVTYRVDVKVPFGTDVTGLVASFTSSPMSCVYINGLEWTAEDLQCSGEYDEIDFTNAVTYTVKAQNGDESYYNVYVLFDAPLTEKALTVFNLTNNAYCTGLNISPATFNIAGAGTTAIAVSVKAGTNLTTLSYSFEVSPSATVTASNGTPVKVGTTVTGTANFTTPVTFTVTAQDNSTQAYVVTVTPRAVNSQKQLTKYWLKGAPVNAIGGLDIMGTINEAEKKVEVWVPWGSSLTSLVASFELNNNSNNFAGGAIMTHSEDLQYVQTSGVTPNDFTTPVAYTVIAEDCSTVEYFVTIKMTPNTDTGISAFNFTYTDCGCDLVNRIDAYARRIYITVPSTVSISSLAPTSIVITPAIGTKPGASISPAVGVAQNWTNGPVKYTVTAPDGVTKADWMVYVTNPKCKDTDILSFSLPNAQVTEADLVPGFGKPVVIDAVNHKIDVIIKKGVNLTSIAYERTLPCGATICCVGGNCQDNHFLDFSQGGCHTCVVTAQDQTVTQEWTICVHEIDVAIPTVETWSVMAYNCTDSVAVQSNELGRVFIVNEKAINMSQVPTSCIPMYNLADWTGTGSTSVAKLVENRMGAWANVTAVDTPVYVQTNGLYGGAYWAFSVDEAGRISCISTQRLYLDICDVTVATLCDLRNQPDVWRYTLSQEVLVNHEETRAAGGNWKFVQTADCGILIEDRLAALPTTYGVGAGLTNLKGMIDKTGIAIKFIPVCCYTPAKTTGNVVPVKELTWNEFNSQVYSATKAFESMLVKITTPIIASNDYGQGPNWMFDDLDLHTVNAIGGSTYFIQSVFNSPLIGTAIPTVPAYYTGVRTNLPWGTVIGAITPRKAADITLVTAPVISANPNPAKITGILPGQCKSTTIKIYNEGVGNMEISALYLDDNAAVDEFNIVTPPVVPFILGTWTYQEVVVNFCPLDGGNEATNLVVEYGVGKTLVVPITGETAIINAIPNCMTFNAPHPGASDFGAAYAGWSHPADNTANLQNYVSTAWVNFDGSAVMNMRPRAQVGGVRQTTWMVSPGYMVTGSDPVISWNEIAYSGFNGSVPKVSPRNLYVSTNGTTWTLVDSYTSGSMPDGFTGGVWRNKTYSLASYTGQTIWWKFELASVANEYTYWCIDNICVQERISAPIISASPNPGDFGGVQVDAVGTLNFAVKNVGISVLKVKNVSVSGEGFTLTDTNTYPFEVVDGPDTWAYTVGANGSALNFAVDFKPTDIGVKTGKITITYGLYSDMVLEIPISGEGLSCSTAAVAVKGQNYAPSQNTWFKYTADKFSIVQVTSCDAHQALTAGEYAWDTYLYVYADCAGTLLAENDDMEGACVYNRASSSVQVVVNAGETIYIFWPLAFPTALYAYDGFYFNINVSYPTDGDVCENAIPLTLPVVNHFGTTVGFADDYNISPCSPFSNYMDGNDKVYTITTTEEGYLNGTILGAYGSIHVLDVCPTEELEKFHCKAFTGGPNGGTGFRKKLDAGTYFVIISSWAPPQTVDFLLNMSWESGSSIENGDLTGTMNVYPNPNSGRFTVSISNTEATDMILELVNISGQVVYRNEVKAAYNHNEDIDASTFAKGVYYLKVNDGKGVKIEKVVVQ
jgi:hypothetical protein